jgi:3,4-dihydroxy 2-butanone 4-phosphate synthase/GTP cyclohydrolase II
MSFTDVEHALVDLRGGRSVVLKSRGGAYPDFLILAAAKATTTQLRLMASSCTGGLGIALTPERIESIGLTRSFVPRYRTLSQLSEQVQPAPRRRDDRDLAKYVRQLADSKRRVDMQAIPSSLSIIRSQWGGVVACPSASEAAVDLARLAGLNPAGVLCALDLPRGHESSARALERFRVEHGLHALGIDDVLSYRRAKAERPLIQAVSGVKLPTSHGVFTTHVMEDLLSGRCHLAFEMGDIGQGDPVLTRVHSECLTGDVLGSLRCDCGRQLDLALKQIGEAKRGVLLYLREEGRGIGLSNKLLAYSLQDKGLDTVEANEHLGYPADGRDLVVASEILHVLGVRKVRLLTNNPRKITGLQQHGLDVVERVPLVVEASSENARYLETKRQKLGHLLHAVSVPRDQLPESLRRGNWTRPRGPRVIP